MPKESHANKFRKLVKDLSITHDSVSKKRNYVDSFGDRDYELERYGQHIDADYFTHNYGHGAHTLTETK
jgi:hypothetical protein